MNIQSDLSFNDYGDIEFVNGNISVIKNQLDILRQNCIDRIKTNFGDYKLNKNIGADIQNFTGKSVDSILLSKIKESIIRSLTVDNFLERENIQCAVVEVSAGTIFIKIEIYTNILGYSFTTMSINSTFSTTNGVLNVYK
jgi:hypothetical protein